MAALAYALLPVTGLIAFVAAAQPRVRFHGLQAIALGLVWPLFLYAAGAVSPLASQIVFGAGVVLWLGLLVATLLGRDPKLPGLARVLAATAGYEDDAV